MKRRLQIVIEGLCKIRVRYAETDAMGFAHHANYFIWFEAARIELMDQLGLSYQKIEQELQVFMPVLTANVIYKKPCRFDDRLEVSCTIKARPKARLTVHYAIHKSGILICEGETLHGFINPEGKPVRPPAAFTEIVNSYF